MKKNNLKKNYLLGNDHNLRKSRYVVISTTAITGTLMFLAGVFLFTNSDTVFFGFLVWLIGGLSAWCMYINSMAYLEMMCDVKLIRNKLYNVVNTGLDDFIGYPNIMRDIDDFDDTLLNDSPCTETHEDSPTSTQLDELKQNDSTLASIRNLLELGLITAEDYTRMRKEYDNKNK